MHNSNHFSNKSYYIKENKKYNRTTYLNLKDASKNSDQIALPAMELRITRTYIILYSHHADVPYRIDKKTCFSLVLPLTDPQPSLSCINPDNFLFGHRSPQEMQNNGHSHKLMNNCYTIIFFFYHSSNEISIY